MQRHSVHAQPLRLMFQSQQCNIQVKNVQTRLFCMKSHILDVFNQLLIHTSVAYLSDAGSKNISRCRRMMTKEHEAAMKAMKKALMMYPMWLSRWVAISIRAIPVMKNSGLEAECWLCTCRSWVVILELRILVALFCSSSSCP